MKDLENKNISLVYPLYAKTFCSEAYWNFYNEVYVQKFLYIHFITENFCVKQMKQTVIVVIKLYFFDDIWVLYFVLFCFYAIQKVIIF